jgi:phage gpG-like protein
VKGQSLTTKAGHTRAAALKKMLNAKPLRDRGQLASSFSAQVSGDEVRVGSGDIRAGTHQFGAGQGAYGRTKRGGPIPWGDIPARPMLPIRDGAVDLPADDRADILDLITQKLEAAL